MPMRASSKNSPQITIEKLWGRRSACRVCRRASELLALPRGPKISILSSTRRTSACWRRKKRCRSKLRREKRVTHSSPKSQNAGDLVETFLINLLRGAGLTGLAAMREVSTRHIGAVDLTIVRPLLSVWRSEIDVYVRAHRLKFREDASNKTLSPLRNRIRHRVVPYLEKTLGRNIRQNIWRTATIAADEENWIDNQVRVSPNRHDHLSVKELRILPIALQRRTILKWLRAQNISGIGFDAIERVRSLLDPTAHVAKVNLAKDRHVRRRAGNLFVEL